MDIIKQARQSQKNEIKAINSSVPVADKTEVKSKWPSPLADAAYYGLAGEMVRLIAPHSEADPVALLANSLTAFSSIVGSKAHVKVEADEHPARLFTVLVGETSKARKGTSWSYIKDIFTTIEPEWKEKIQSGLSSGEGLIWAVRNEILKKKAIKEGGETVGFEDEVIDSGVPDKRLLVVEGEFASVLRVLGREGNTLSAVIRNAWDNGDLQSLTKNSLARATNSHILIIGHITRDELSRYLTTTEAGNGFGNRFLWLCVKRSKILPFGGLISQVDFNPLIGQLREAVNFAKNTKEIRWADNTKPIWTKIYPELSEGKPGLVGSVTARSEAYATRLACVYALLDKSKLIKPVHLKAALAFWDYAESSTKYIFRDMLGDETADMIIEALQIGSLSRTEISNYFGRHKDSDEISRALDVLLSVGRVKRETVSTKGRDKEVWTLAYPSVRRRRKKGKKGSKNKNRLNSPNSLNSQPKDKFLLTTP